MSDNLPAQAAPNTTVLTGWDLVLEVRRQGGFMLAAQRRIDYLKYKEHFIELLKVAEKDALAGPYLTREVQFILDEESKRFRDGWDKS